MSLETEARPPARDLAPPLDIAPPKIQKPPDDGKTFTQWAKVPESAAYMGLDATALDVLIILASKAGRDRTGWIAQQTVAERLGKGRTTIGKAIQRLEKLDLVRKSGRVVVDKTRGTWVQRYKVAPYLPVVTPGVTSGITLGGPDVTFDGPDVTFDGPDVTLGLPDVTLGGPDVADQAGLATHSVPIDQSLSFSPSVSAEAVGKEKQERPQGQERSDENKRKMQAQAKAFREEQARRLGRRRGLVLDDPTPDPDPEPAPEPAPEPVPVGEFSHTRTHQPLHPNCSECDRAWHQGHEADCSRLHG